MFGSQPDDPFTLLMLDVDRFKTINDGHGHATGDAEIRAVAGVLRETGALAGRLGGEEFGRLMTGHGPESGAAVDHRIRTRCVGRRVRGPDGDVAVTVSVGLADRSRGEGIEPLVRRVDGGLYAAKAAGRNRVAFIDGQGIFEIVG